MDPWCTATDFRNVFRHELRQSIFLSVGAVKENKAMHGFDAPDAGNRTDRDDKSLEYFEVFANHLPMFSMPEHQYHVIINSFASVEEN